MKMRQIGVIVTVTVTVMVLVVVAFAAMALQNVGAVTQSADSGLAIVSFSTDKDLYSAREEMIISLTLRSPAEIRNASIAVTGVKSTKGVYYVQYASHQNVTAGENTIITFTKKLPSCSRCAGISQGTYFINASVTHDGAVVTATHSIAITSDPDHIIAVDVGVEEAQRMLEFEPGDITLLDVRTPEAYHMGHIDRALSIPFSELSNKTETLNKSAKVLVYDADGVNSTLAADLLIEQRFVRVYTVIGGLNAWEERGYAVVSDKTPGLKEPGFDVVLALVVVFAVAYRLRRR